MSAPPKFSLAAQIEALALACTRQATLANGGTVRGLRGQSAEEYDLQRLQAVTRTLLWMQANDAEIRAFVDARKASKP